MNIFLSFPTIVLIIAVTLVAGGLWLKTLIAQERKKDMDEFRRELNGTVMPTLDKTLGAILSILEKQNQINRDLYIQNDANTKTLSDKSESNNSE